METVKCNLCGSADLEFVYKIPDQHFFHDEWFSVVECRQCGLGFTNPRPTMQEIGRYYPSEFYDNFADETQQHTLRYQMEARFIEDASRTGEKKLLDVGCANGDFPRFMRAQGWNVEGVEVAENSNPITDFTVYTQDFRQIPVNCPTYDVVTAWAVLEHVHDPMGYFQKASEVLKPGGALIFLVTNFNSVSSRCLFCEDVPRHLYFFTEKAVRQYLDKTGFALETADYSDKVYAMPPTNWLRYFLGYRLTGRKFTWQDANITRQRYFAEKGLSPTPGNNLRFLIRYPLLVVDRLLMPLYAKYQMRTGQYGIVTYVARKK